MCECVSTIPGMTNLPAASITRVSAGTSRFVPIAAILPSWMSRSVSGRVPPVTVRSVPPRTRIVSAAFVTVVARRTTLKTLQATLRTIPNPDILYPPYGNEASQS